MDIHTRLRSAQEENKKLRMVLMELYTAGKWVLPLGGEGEEDMARMWENARDALNLPEGFATKLGVGR